MKTICIETVPSPSIIGGVRHGNVQTLYTTFSEIVDDKIRDHNTKRRDIEIISLLKAELKQVLYEKNNIQIVSNNGSHGVLGLESNPMGHRLLSKIGLVQLLGDYGLDKYIPGSFIIQGGVHKDMNSLIFSTIKNNFKSGEKVVIKHPTLDGNGNGVYIFEYTGNKILTKSHINSAFDKFIKISGNQIPIIHSDYLVQKFIDNTIGEGSITFSIQNDSLDNRGLVNNYVKDGEYFASTNYFNGLNKEQITVLEKSIEKDFTPLLNSLRDQGVRGNIGFDLFYKIENKICDVFILESNGLYRTTGSTLPNSFGFNTINEKYFGIPLTQDKILSDFADFSIESQLNLADRFESFGTQKSKEQIMNIKCEGFERGHPVIWVAVAGNSYAQIKNLLIHSDFLNENGLGYVNNILQQLE